ncbi:HNH endonuclease family protein [Cellulosimicrobium cellulans]|uniref:HNH endonuclease family protein n=1 Tax=Cellulosimicrobium cellulans TaxID=1710 RepID=UPI0037FAD69A
MLVGTPTNNLNRIFTTLVGQIASFGEPGIADALHRFLSEPGKYWPSDAELRDKAETSTFAVFQRVTQRYFVLRRLEEHRAKDGYIDWTSANFTLEHFMPQKLTAQWSTHLRQSGVRDVEHVHRELVDTIGNCTLTSLNQKLSNSFLDRKQEIISGSTLHLNTEIAESADWLPDDIRKRSRRLINDAIEIWEGPLATVSDAGAPDLSAVEVALAALTGAEWTSANALAEACEVSYDDVVAYLDEARPSEHQRVLNQEGVPDPRRAWVRDEGLTSIGEHLVALGVLASTVDLTADKSLFVDGTAIAERVGS